MFTPILKRGIQILVIAIVLFSFKTVNARFIPGIGDTTVVQTLRFDTTMRAGVFMFPDDTTKTYEKIIMLYSMRCKNGLVSTGSNTNLGCGEWDYNCYTYVVDSSKTDSLHAYQPSYEISGVSDTVFSYTTQPVYSYTQYNQTQINYTNVISESTYVIGTGNTALTDPLNATSKISKTQFLWTAAELTFAGFTAGDITGLRMDVSALGSTVDNLRINIKATAQTVLNPDSPETTGFTEVYFLNTSIASTGMNSFNFSSPFTWDGTSNIIVEFTHTSPVAGSDNAVNGNNSGFTSSMTSSLDDSYLNFGPGLSYMQVNPASYSSISNEITIAFWAYGDTALLPANTAILEAYDATNNRQVNIHLPWSDSNIYWDCGNDGTGYDRINKLATTPDIEGKWNFWTFTKNAVTGSMKIYLNGALWQLGTGKFKPINIQNFLVGRGINTTNSYYGNLDELSIWNKELSQASIQAIMYHDITPSHPDYAFLQVYNQFNEGTGSTASDASGHGFDGQLTNGNWRSHRGNTLYRNFTASTNRPNTTFVRGTYNVSVNNITTLDSVLNNATSIIAYNVTNNALNIVDTTYVWPATYSYIYNSFGSVIDSIPVTAQNTLNVTQLEYYRRRPMYFELINFITPYGINLNLDGLNGKTWQFDVTDYAPVLRGAKFLAMADGNHQEDNDIKFVFYEGTPPRTVKSISEIWPSGSWVSPSYTEIVNNSYFEPRDIQLSPDASMFKIRSSISGHGQEGEFIARTHTIRLNNSINFSRSVWVECATNPIYPQGGTWIYDRAGWCPGAAVDTKEYEITSNVTPGTTINLDYSLPANPNPGQSNYRVNNLLVSYGPPNFTLDAAVNYVKSPSKRTEFTRVNPLCNQPVVSIKNTGSTTLTSLEIHYGRKGGTLSTYNWSGNLDFLASTEVTLPQPAWMTSNINEFEVYVTNPNGAADQYAQNDTMYSTFDTPSVYVSNLVFELKTNNYASQNTYTLKDSQGNIIINKTGLTANTVYRDTVNLASDCYTVYMNDAGDDGLSFWANTAQGSGYFRIKNASTGVVVKSFNADFGDNINHQFTVGYVLPVNEIKGEVKGLEVYPNPASDMFTAEFSLPIGSEATVRVVDLLGKEMARENVMVTQEVEKLGMESKSLEDGVYFVIVTSGSSQQVKKLLINR